MMLRSSIRPTATVSIESVDPSISNPALVTYKVVIYYQVGWPGDKRGSLGLLGPGFDPLPRQICDIIMGPFLVE